MIFSKNSDRAEERRADSAVEKRETLRGELEAEPYTERTAALDALVQSIEARQASELAALETHRIEIVRRAEAETAAARERVERRRNQMAEAIASGFQAEVAPHVAAWVSEPSRPTAAAIADVFCKHDQRAQHQLGSELWHGSIGLAFANEVMKSFPKGMVEFSQPDWGRGSALEASARFRKVAHRRVLPDLETALRDIETTFFGIAQGAMYEPTAEHVARFKMKVGCATGGDYGRRREEDFNREQARARAAAAEPMQRPEEPRGVRGVRAFMR